MAEDTREMEKALDTVVKGILLCDKDCQKDIKSKVAEKLGMMEEHTAEGFLKFVMRKSNVDKSTAREMIIQNTGLMKLMFIFA